MIPLRPDGCCHSPTATCTLTISFVLQADEDAKLYWQYVESWDPTAVQPDDSSKCWEDIVTRTSSILNTSVSKMIPPVLAVRQYSARLAMFSQLAQHMNSQAEVSSAAYRTQ
jgi:hypothetical protein